MPSDDLLQALDYLVKCAQVGLSTVELRKRLVEIHPDAFSRRCQRC